ncbi:MAG: helix-turn-helix domain-containing protein [Roseobacter sp.]|uniref:helix-turn-helix domain-containing protein n=1 Tax=Rhodopirellula bahusiensis TaxID=2014065 RepID=UPI00329AAD08
MKDLDLFDSSIEQLITVSDAAAQCGVSRSFLYREIAARRIAHYRLRGQIRIAASALADYLARHHQSSIGTISPTRKHF